MSRAQRRRKEWPINSRGEPVTYCGYPDGCKDLKDGDEFTIKGIRMYPDGSFMTDCEPGMETLFTAKASP